MMVGRRLTVLVFFLECISLFVVSAFPLSTVRKKESQPQEELNTRAAVERRWVDSERPLSPAHRVLRPPPLVSEQEITTKQPLQEQEGRGQRQRDRNWGAGLQSANILSRLTPAQLVRLYLLLYTDSKTELLLTHLWRLLCSVISIFLVQFSV